MEHFRFCSPMSGYASRFILPANSVVVYHFSCGLHDNLVSQDSVCSTPRELKLLAFVIHLWLSSARDEHIWEKQSGFCSGGGGRHCLLGYVDHISILRLLQQNRHTLRVSEIITFPDQNSEFNAIDKSLEWYCFGNSGVRVSPQQSALSCHKSH